MPQRKGSSDMAAIKGLRQTPLSNRHIDGACALVAEAGWNQTADDWCMMINGGEAIGFEDEAGRLVASALILPYDPAPDNPAFGWISMVLVAADWRRRGIATHLLHTCIATLESAGRMPVLDATPDGRKVYTGLGFKSDFTIQRWQCAAPSRQSLTKTGHDARMQRQITAADIDQIIKDDRRAFGGDRTAILRDIATRDGALGWIRNDGCGYLLSRAGRLARQLGPLWAANDDAALSLLDAALRYFDEPTFIDVPDRHARMVASLTACGFMSQRPFLRMSKGDGLGLGDPAHIYALAGPELG
ncbi:MAG: GNAT family N-acetyltransferase [Alphaproteobacteria bacterium]